MKLFLAVLILFAVAIIGMAVGVIFSNRRLKGTCGGLGNMQDAQGRSICDACTTPAKDCTGIPKSAECDETRSMQPAGSGHRHS